MAPRPFSPSSSNLPSPMMARSNDKAFSQLPDKLARMEGLDTGNVKIWRVSTRASSAISHESKDTGGEIDLKEALLADLPTERRNEPKKPVRTSSAVASNKIHPT